MSPPRGAHLDLCLIFLLLRFSLGTQRGQHREGTGNSRGGEGTPGGHRDPPGPLPVRRGRPSPGGFMFYLRIRFLRHCGTERERERGVRDGNGDSGDTSDTSVPSQ